MNAGSDAVEPRWGRSQNWGRMHDWDNGWGFHRTEESDDETTNKTEKVFDLVRTPDRALETIFLHLPMNDVSAYRRVCKKWNGLIESDLFQRKVERLAIRGNLSIEDIGNIVLYRKDSWETRPFIWECCDREPVIRVIGCSDESRLECTEKHTKATHDNGRVPQQHIGTWLDYFSRVPDFPCRLPLRLLISKFPKEGGAYALQPTSDLLMPYHSENVEGRLDKNILHIMFQYLGVGNNQLHLVFKGKPVILTCVDNKEPIKGKLFTCWQEILGSKIEESLKGEFIREADLKKAKQAAAEHDKKAVLAVRHRWIYAGNCEVSIPKTESGW